VAKPLGRRRIRNVFGMPPSAVPRDAPARRARPTHEPPFDIDAVRMPKPPPKRRRRKT
jgi:hypothetical protein